MIAPAIPRDETVRLAALCDSGLLGVPDDYPLDCVTNIGARLFDVPMCMLSLVDADRQWFASCVGLDVQHTPRDVSFCGHVVADRRSMVVEDTLLDVRFADNPLVVGYPRIRFYAGYPIRAATGEVIGSLCVLDTRPREFAPRQHKLLRELAVLAQSTIATRQTSAAQSALIAKLAAARRESMIDPLLRVWNRSGITAIIEQTHQSSSHRGEPYCVLMLDLDHFKRINDSHGHLIGDRVLKSLARELRSGLRSSDNLGRFGGDEFLIVLPKTTGAEAERSARRINDVVSQLRVEVAMEANGCTVSIGCSVSVGVAEWSARSGESVEQLIHRADMALLAAKQAGRNAASLSKPVDPAREALTDDSACAGDACA